MNANRDRDSIGLFELLFSDGRHFLTLGSLCLMFAGGMAVFLGAVGQFLPHDVAFLGMTAKELCSHNACNIVHFMIHDRVSFGGALIGLSILYLWLIHFPLAANQAWAWWALCISNIAGFSSFLSYLGYGYLDTWHAVATLLLLPCFAVGLAMTFSKVERPRGISEMFRPGEKLEFCTQAGVGRAMILLVGLLMMMAGLVISIVGMTVVFVPQDLEFMDTTREALNSINLRLIPLIAHDRAGFGGGVFNVGLLIFFCTWCGKRSRNLWQAVSISGVIGYAMAIGIHPLVGYNNFVHLAPACFAAAIFIAGILLTRKSMLSVNSKQTEELAALSTN